jgi:hypothetical protein
MWKTLIQGYIQQEHIDPRLAEEAQIRPIGSLGNQRFNLIWRNAASLGDPSELYLGISRTDVRVETGR